MKLCRTWPSLRPHVWRHVYRFISRRYPPEAFSCMNYGYALLEEGSIGPELSPAQLSERYCLQLYHFVASAVDITGKDVLEIGCGRAGGTRFLKTHFAPRRLVAADFLLPAIPRTERCRPSGLEFVNADSHFLPFCDQLFDVAINIESSHCYSSISTFFDEVKRVLRPNGYFVYADFCRAPELHERRALLRASGMSLISEDDISENVVAALHTDHERRMGLIKKYARGWLSKPFAEFAGTRHSKIFGDFETRRKIYFRFVMTKQK
jgi:ubiquinone/menaquinone biosynthesis C-methylase UbiE